MASRFLASSSSSASSFASSLPSSSSSSSSSLSHHLAKRQRTESTTGAGGGAVAQQDHAASGTFPACTPSSPYSLGVLDQIPSAVFGFVIQPFLSPYDLLQFGLCNKTTAQVASPRLLSMLHYIVDTAWPKRCCRLIQKHKYKKEERQREERYEKRQQALKKKPLPVGSVGVVVGGATSAVLGSSMPATQDRKKKRRRVSPPSPPKDCGSTPCLPKFHNQRLLENQRQVDGVEKKGGGDGSFYRCIQCSNAAICNESTYLLVVPRTWTMTHLLDICGERWLKPLWQYKTGVSQEDYRTVAKATWTRYHMDLVTTISALHVRVLRRRSLDAVVPQLNDDTKTLLAVPIRDDVVRENNRSGHTRDVL